MLSYLFYVFMVKSPYINPYDENGCCISCGYQWCPNLNTCVRLWETYCESLENGH
jgi:hypothetical protein